VHTCSFSRHPAGFNSRLPCPTTSTSFQPPSPTSTSPTPIHQFTMPPPRALFLRTSTLRIATRPIHQPALLRCYSNKTSPQSTPPKTPATPAQDALPHVSEEAAATAGITGETKPELEQGTPIQEVCASISCFGQHRQLY
jgi:hypothetical protein